MSVTGINLSRFVLLVVSPALLFLAPGLPTIGIVVLFAAFYVVFFVQKPRLRCVPCGEIVTLTPKTYVLVLQNKLPCPRCNELIKNKHGV